jgi:hypothetical protein
MILELIGALFFPFIMFLLFLGVNILLIMGAASTNPFLYMSSFVLLFSEIWFIIVYSVIARRN